MGKIENKSTNNAGSPGNAPAQDKLDELGIDALCDMIERDESYSDISEQIGVSEPVICRWIAADPERSARVRESRIKSANSCDTKAEKALEAIASNAQQGEITRQRELASHYRWRARVRDPRQYGEKVAHGGDPDAPPIETHHTITFVMPK